MQDTEEAVLLPAQVRAARALLAWTQDRLAGAAWVGNSTVRDFEAGRRTPRRNHLAAIRAALEAAGVGFVHDGGRIGVELRGAQNGSSSAGAVAPVGDDGSSPAAAPEAEPASPEPPLGDAEALVGRMRREAANARGTPGVRRRDLLRAFRLIEEAADDCLDVMAGIRATLGEVVGVTSAPSHLDHAGGDAGEGPPPRDRGWRLAEHVCRICAGRVLQRGEKFRCSGCALEAKETLDSICCCGLPARGEDGLGLYRCVRNPSPSRDCPWEIVVAFDGVPIERPPPMHPILLQSSHVPTADNGGA